MSDEEFEHYLRLIMSMTIDYFGGGINRETYIDNFNTIADKIKGEDEESN